MLTDPEFTVPPVPRATTGVAWLRANVVRFSEGEDHARRREIVHRMLSTVDPNTLDRPGHHVATLAEALGLPRTVVHDVERIARCYQPHLPTTEEADAAVARLVDIAGDWDEATANRIGLLVQACDSTAALIAGHDTPVPTTRRVDRDGRVVVVPLEGRPFGEGPHACPGRAHAQALAAGATRFRALHHGDRPLLLPNAWDFASAAALAQAGFPAVGTTSLGVAAANGLPDAAGVALPETLSLARKIARLPIPVTIDVEAGFGVDPHDLAAELYELGVAGVNIEDARGDTLADPEHQAAIVARFKRGAPNLFVNARTDTHWLHVAQDETLDRVRRYADAGADGVFVPGLTDERAIAAVVAAVDVPVNTLAQLDFSTLADLGVRRVSTGSLLFRVALRAAVDTALGAKDDVLPTGIPGYQDIRDLIG
ncbi:isocitrate lyase/phosphoenolpyruvate mutase family protein [Actinosynnema sp. NPDC020468]|uniref:isocitrate lyase/PEP mutase family protein n=1 Tax=Actinosynnema sp. NPDC020468 TaxID=3154488 RepID=UPI0033CEA0DD